MAAILRKAALAKQRQLVLNLDDFDSATISRVFHALSEILRHLSDGEVAIHPILFNDLAEEIVLILLEDFWAIGVASPTADALFAIDSNFHLFTSCYVT
jgi:hypothetical protein